MKTSKAIKAPLTLLGGLGASAQVESTCLPPATIGASKELSKADILMHAARVKAERRLIGNARKEMPTGSRWKLFSIKLSAITVGEVRLDHFSVRVALEDAIKENDWEFLHALSRWHKERKPIVPDALRVFMDRNWKAFPGAKGGWKGLRDLNDTGIAEFANTQGIEATKNTVRDRRLDMQLEGWEPRFTFSKESGKLILKRLRA